MPRCGSSDPAAQMPQAGNPSWPGVLHRDRSRSPVRDPWQEQIRVGHVSDLLARARESEEAADECKRKATDLMPPKSPGTPANVDAAAGRMMGKPEGGGGKWSFKGKGKATAKGPMPQLSKGPGKGKGNGKMKGKGKGKGMTPMTPQMLSSQHAAMSSPLDPMLQGLQMPEMQPALASFKASSAAGVAVAPQMPVMLPMILQSPMLPQWHAAPTTPPSDPLTAQQLKQQHPPPAIAAGPPLQATSSTVVASTSTSTMGMTASSPELLLAAWKQLPEEIRGPADGIGQWLCHFHNKGFSECSKVYEGIQYKTRNGNRYTCRNCYERHSGNVAWQRGNTNEQPSMPANVGHDMQPHGGAEGHDWYAGGGDGGDNVGNRNGDGDDGGGPSGQWHESNEGDRWINDDDQWWGREDSWWYEGWWNYDGDHGDDHDGGYDGGKW